MMVLGFVIAQIVIFVVIIFVLKNLIFHDTTSAVNRISKLDNMNREKERLLNKKLVDADKYVEERKKALEDEEKKIQQEAHRAASQLHDDILKKAKEEGDDIIKKAHAVREKIRTEARIEAEAQVVDFAGEILRRILSRTILKHVNDALIQEFMAQVEKEDLSKLGKDIGKVTAIFANPAQEEIKKLIKQILTNKLAGTFEVNFKEDPALVGGMSLQFGTMIIDGSLAQSMRDAAEALKDELMFKSVS